MPGEERDPLVALSEALATRAEAARHHAVAVRTRHHRRSGILWRGNVVVASDQVFPKADEAEIVLGDGRSVPARVAGRDSGSNVVALRLGEPVEAAALPQPAAPRLGGLALCLGATGDGAPTVRLAVVRSLGPAWHSLAGGLIDHRITLDLRLSAIEEGGPVVDAGGGLLGMSTSGPRGRALVIPSATIARVLEPLLASGRIERGWLGVALHPVALGDESGDGGQRRGLMVMQVKADGPAARAGIHRGDIVLRVGDVPAIYPAQISRLLGPESVGRAIELQLVRAGAELTLQAAITARPTG